MSEKKKKEKTSIALPKAWQSMKHRNETAQARANYNDIWSAIGIILLILVIIFVALGGVSQTGIIKFVFNWSHNVGEKVSNWFEGGSVIVNEDGVYYDPTGQKGDKIGEDNNEVMNIADELENVEQIDDSENTEDAENQTEEDQTNIQNNEVLEE